MLYAFVMLNALNAGELILVFLSIVAINFIYVAVDTSTNWENSFSE